MTKSVHNKIPGPSLLREFCTASDECAGPWNEAMMKEAPHCWNERLTATAEFGSRVTRDHDCNELLCLKLVLSGTVNPSLSRGVKNGTAFHQILIGP